jgi:coiled-coil domain-containing protein 61
MLCSAFSKETDSVVIDILTFSDLEMLKAKKMNSNLNAQPAISTKNQHKRYAIMTYSGEFDRVHYPLPLAFEEKSNVSSLQRAIKRLRNQLREKSTIDQQPANDREK